MAGHTPGPWEWDAGDDGTDYSHPYCSVSTDGGNLIIAEVNDRFDREAGRANAALIAAAPELLAALTDIAKGNVPPGEMPVIDANTFHSEMMEWCQKRARAAIAAATLEVTA